ncbi:MAG: hypothetical protein JW862_17380 [Anaerolineales bacterium]|nr:hypothetical protein [Anaerolineales bacterium]
MNSNSSGRSWAFTILAASVLAVAWVVGAFLLAFIRPVGDVERVRPQLADYSSNVSLVFRPLADDVIQAARIDNDATNVIELPTVSPSASATTTASITPSASPTPTPTATSTSTRTPLPTQTLRPTRTSLPTATTAPVQITNTPGSFTPTFTATPDQPRPSATNPAYPPPPATTTVPRPSNTPGPTPYP